MPLCLARLSFPVVRASRWKAPKSCRSSLSTTSEPQVPRPEVLTLLHKATSFLPRILPPKAHSGFESLDFWHSVLSGAQAELSAGSKSPVRIVVYGLDEWAGASELLTALLENTFASNDTERIALRNRWKNLKNTGNGIVIESTDSPRSENVLRVSSPWLAQFKSLVQIKELPSGSTDSAHMLFSADIPIILCNPLTTHLPTFFSSLSLPLANPNAIVILTSPPSSSLLQYLAKTHSRSHLRARILMIDPTAALSALDVLISSPGNPHAIQRFQDAHASSGISALTPALASVLSPPTSITLPASAAIASLREALGTCSRMLSSTNDEVDSAHARLDALRDRVAELCVRTQAEILGTGGEVLDRALEIAERDMKNTLDALTWWRMTFGVDEISISVSQALERAWCRDLEKKLIFHVGQLEALQCSLTEAALTHASAPSPTLHSAVLINSLEQLKVSPSYLLGTSTLTGPLHKRRSQLSTYTTMHLHLAAQRATLLTMGSVFGGAGTAGVLEFYSAVGTETAMGAGILAVLLGIRWSVGIWARAKRRWWEDWKRVGEGLERDLEEVVERTISEKVTVVADASVKGSEARLKQRGEQLQELKQELGNLTEELGNLEQRIYQT